MMLIPSRHFDLMTLARKISPQAQNRPHTITKASLHLVRMARAVVADAAVADVAVVAESVVTHSMALRP